MKGQFDLLMDEQVGFGKFQIFAFTVICLCLSSGGYLVYHLEYLLLFPEYDCNGEEECTPEQFCQYEDFEPPVNWKSDRSLHNWIEKFDLKCANELKISSFGMTFFAGWTFGSFFVPQMGDKYGRKKVFIYSMLMSAILLLATLLMPGGSDLVPV